MSRTPSAMDASWWKSYVVYAVVVAPFVVLSVLFVHGRVATGVVSGIIVFGGLTVKDRVQRKIWP